MASQQASFGFCIDGISVPFELSKYYIAGRWGEERVRDIFRRDLGKYVVELCQQRTSGAPSAISYHKPDLVLPDFLVLGDGEESYVEVKTKTRATKNELYRRRLEHGLGLRLLQHYSRIAKESGKRVLVCFYEISTGCLLGDELGRLRQTDYAVYTGDKMDKGGMVFFPRSSLAVIYEPPDSSLEAFAAKTVRR